MTLPLFADTDDLEPRLPAGSDVDVARAEAALADASALIHAETNEVWVEDGVLVTDVPGIALTICCKAAIRALINPAGVTQQSTGPFSATFVDVYLTGREREMLRTAAGGTSGLWTLATTRCENDIPDIYLDVIGQDEQIVHAPKGTELW